MYCKSFLGLGFLLFFFSCMGQNKEAEKAVGGPCEGCEAIYEYRGKGLNSVDTLPEFRKQGVAMKVTGTIFQKDGKTPAGDIILFIYHTDPEGIYPKKGGEEGWARRQGYLRGWIRTGNDGRYSFYTNRPGNYPNSETPAHIHAVVKEPKYREYYLADFEFTGDPFVMPVQDPRGGSGLVNLEREGELLVARRDIILGLNIPDYE